MELYNRYFHRSIQHLDPGGMLNVPFSVYSDKKRVKRYFKTNDDYRKLNVPWMCEQLIALLVDIDETVGNSSTVNIQDTFQLKKIKFIWISQAFIGLIVIQTNSVDAYGNLVLTCPTYKKNIAIHRGPKKRKKKTNQISHDNPIPLLNEVIQNQQIEPHQVNLATNHDEEHILLALIQHQNSVQNIINKENVSAIRESNLIQQLHIQPIKECPTFNQNVLHENKSLPIEELGLPLMDIDIVQPKNLELQQVIQPNPMDLLEKQNQAEQLIEHQQIIGEQRNQMPTENDFPENILSNQLKRKSVGDIRKRSVKKKKQIERSSKTFKNRLKKLAGELADRPLECLDQKYNNQLMNHLPLRHAMYRDKLNIEFAALTLNIELEENEKQDDGFNTAMLMSNYLAITNKIDHNSIPENCIFHQVLNNALPHLILLPLPEEYVTDNSLMWRDTMNEINKKLEGSLKDVSEISKIDEYKFVEFKERIKHRVSLVAQRTLIGNDISHINSSGPPLILPLTPLMDKMLNDKTFSDMPQVITENIPNMTCLPSIIDDTSPNLLPPMTLYNQMPLDRNQDRFKQDDMQDSQIFAQPVSQKIDIMKLINNFLLVSERKTSLLFTDLCPIHTTNRKYAILVLVELLGLHKQGTVKLNQTNFTTEPSSVVIELNIDQFDKM